MMGMAASITELKILQITANELKNPVTMVIGEQATKLCSKFTKIQKQLEAWIATPSALKEKGLLMLANQVLAVNKEKDDLVSQAQRLGMVKATKKRKAKH